MRESRDPANRTAPGITTPSSVDAGTGTLEFTDGYPTVETASRLRDHLDYPHGVEAFMNSIQGVSIFALREGVLSAGIMDGDVLISSELMDSRSLFLTANADTLYFLAFLDLSGGPVAFEAPSDILGMSTTCVRLGHRLRPPRPGPGAAPTYCFPPGYEGALPEGGAYVRRSRTNHVLLVSPAFINRNEGNDPAPTVTRIKEQMKSTPTSPAASEAASGPF